MDNISTQHTTRKTGTEDCVTGISKYIGRKKGF